MQLECAYADDTLTVGTGYRLILLEWRDAPRIEQMRALPPLYAALFHRYGQKFLFANLITAGTPNFSMDVRREASEQSRDSQTHSAGSAHVVLVEGLRGVATQTFLSGMLLLAKTSAPHKVFNQLWPAARWLASCASPIDKRLGPEPILEAMRALLDGEFG